jgi:hypothetical protein
MSEDLKADSCVCGKNSKEGGLNQYGPTMFEDFSEVQVNLMREPD